MKNKALDDKELIRRINARTKEEAGRRRDERKKEREKWKPTTR